MGLKPDERALPAREAVDLACEQLHLHRTVRASLGATFVANCTAGALERAVLAELSVDSVLHPALRSLPGSRTQVARTTRRGGGIGGWTGSRERLEYMPGGGCSDQPALINGIQLSEWTPRFISSIERMDTLPTPSIRSCKQHQTFSRLPFGGILELELATRPCVRVHHE